MRVLVAGASGAIGRYLVPQLLAAKHEVIGITRTPGSLASTGAQEVVANVLDRSALLAAVEGIKADAVIHQLTALKKAPTTLRDMRETNRLRAEGTSTLVAAARLVGAKKFVAGSFFGGYGLTDHGRRVVTEESPFGELDGRADSVQRALVSLEQQVHAFGGVSLRFGLFYDSTTTSISPVSRTWNGVLPMLHLSDAASATVGALTNYRSRSIYNIADDHPLSYRARETAQAKAAELAAPMALPDSLLRLVAPFGSLLLTRASMTLSTELAHSELGWSPEFPSLFDALGVAAPASDHVVLPIAFAAPAPVPVAEPEPLAELVEAPEPDPTPDLDPVAELVEAPEPEQTPDLDPVAELVEAPEPNDEPEPNPAAKTEPKPEPKPRPAAKHPSAPRKPRTPKPPKDPFGDMDDAIARIGTLHED
jgi:nucleoside-diphosphate-sugar epimerase